MLTVQSLGINLAIQKYKQTNKQFIYKQTNNQKQFWLDLILILYKVLFIKDIMKENHPQ